MDTRKKGLPARTFTGLRRTLVKFGTWEFGRMNKSKIMKKSFNWKGRRLLRSPSRLKDSLQKKNLQKIHQLRARGTRRSLTSMIMSGANRETTKTYPSGSSNRSTTSLKYLCYNAVLKHTLRMFQQVQTSLGQAQRKSGGQCILENKMMEYLHLILINNTA